MNKKYTKLPTPGLLRRQFCLGRFSTQKTACGHPACHHHSGSCQLGVSMQGPEEALWAFEVKFDNFFMCVHFG